MDRSAEIEGSVRPCPQESACILTYSQYVANRDSLDALLRLAPHDFEPDLLVPFHRPAWQQDAACLGAGPGIFYPERGQSIDEAPSRV